MSGHDDETRQIPPTPAPDDQTRIAPASGSGVSRPISASVGSSRATAPPASGVRRIGDYDLESEIARGGMGVVYKARQLSLNRDHPGHLIVLPEQRSTVTRIAFSPDNTRIATLSGQGITLFDTQTGTQLLALRESLGPYHVREVIVPGRAPSGGMSLAFTDSGQQIIETIIASDPKGIRVTIKTWRSN